MIPALCQRCLARRGRELHELRCIGEFGGRRCFLTCGWPGLAHVDRYWSRSSLRRPAADKQRITKYEDWED